MTVHIEDDDFYFSGDCQLAVQHAIDEVRTNDFLQTAYSNLHNRYEDSAARSTNPAISGMELFFLHTDRYRSLCQPQLTSRDSTSVQNGLAVRTKDIESVRTYINKPSIASIASRCQQYDIVQYALSAKLVAATSMFGASLEAYDQNMLMERTIWSFAGNLAIDCMADDQQLQQYCPNWRKAFEFPHTKYALTDSKVLFGLTHSRNNAHIAAEQYMAQFAECDQDN
jgi:hypothetical protein